MVGPAGPRGRLLLVGSALAVAAAVLVVARAETAPPASLVAGGCRSEVSTDVLPGWARVGFGDPEPRVPHVVGTQGRIAAILFGRQLHSPPSPDVRNKVLWVARTGGTGPLVIDAVRAGTGQRAHREIAQGPGPSYVDLPEAGCWRLDLRWGPLPEQRDSLALTYAEP